MILTGWKRNKWSTHKRNRQSIHNNTSIFKVCLHTTLHQPSDMSIDILMMPPKNIYRIERTRELGTQRSSLMSSPFLSRTGNIVL